jgi:hypothetical protein
MTITSHAGRIALTAILLGSTSGLGADDLAFADTTVLPRAQWPASFDRMPEQALATAFLRCHREAQVRMLSFEDGVRCAMAWDALLRRVFAGNVDALLAWWRVHRDESAVADDVYLR